MIQNSNNIEIFGVLGIENKVNIITNIIERIGPDNGGYWRVK